MTNNIDHRVGDLEESRSSIMNACEVDQLKELDQDSTSSFVESFVSAGFDRLIEDLFENLLNFLMHCLDGL